MNRRLAFTADYARVLETDELHVVHLSAGTGGDGEYLKLMRSIVGDSEDYCIILEYGSGYESVSACRLGRHRLEVDLLDLVGLNAFGGVDVVLEIYDEAFRELEDGLAKIFRGNVRDLLTDLPSPEQT